MKMIEVRQFVSGRKCLHVDDNIVTDVIGSFAIGARGVEIRKDKENTVVAEIRINRNKETYIAAFFENEYVYVEQEICEAETLEKFFGDG